MQKFSTRASFFLFFSFFAAQALASSGKTASAKMRNVIVVVNELGTKSCEILAKRDLLLVIHCD